MKILNISLLFALAITLSGCKYEPSCASEQHNYYFVKPEEKAVLPYKGYDTLKLKHSSGAEYTYYAGDIDSGFNLFAKYSHPDCPYNLFTHRQYYALRFFSTTTPDNIIVSLSNDELYKGTLLEVKLRKILFYTSISLITPPPRPNFYDYDSIPINGKIYTYVRKIYPNWNAEDKRYILYNKEYGLLKIDLANGETWERIPN